MDIQSEIEAAEQQADLEKWGAYRKESIKKRAEQAAEQEINRRNSPTPAPYGVAKETPVLTVAAQEAVHKKHEHNAALELKPWFDNPENKEKFIEDLKQKREAELAQSTQQEEASKQAQQQQLENYQEATAEVANHRIPSIEANREAAEQRIRELEEQWAKREQEVCKDRGGREL
jgi:ABC-type amino acid transport substrate-binding protein